MGMYYDSKLSWSAALSSTLKPKWTGLHSGDAGFVTLMNGVALVIYDTFLVPIKLLTVSLIVK